MRFENITVIRVRRGINGFKYSACDHNGYLLFNVEKLADVRKNWLCEIRRGQVVIIRELDKQPDLSALNNIKKSLVSILRSYSK